MEPPLILPLTHLMSCHCLCSSVTGVRRRRSAMGRQLGMMLSPTSRTNA